MPREEEARLLDMLVAAMQAHQFVKEMTSETFMEDHKTQFAVIHLLEIIGEAANNVSDATKVRLAAVPWQDIKGMRNRLAHEYFAVDLSIVWNAARVYVPLLIDQLRTIVPPPEES